MLQNTRLLQLKFSKRTEDELLTVNANLYSPLVTCELFTSLKIKVTYNGS